MRLIDTIFAVILSGTAHEPICPGNPPTFCDGQPRAERALPSLPSMEKTKDKDKHSHDKDRGKNMGRDHRGKHSNKGHHSHQRDNKKGGRDRK